MPLLSVIVPVLNERQTLPALLATLAGQRQCPFELLLCDGGSDDGSRNWVLGQRLPYPLIWLDAPRGRAAQLNFGADRARGRFLLFLHADSLLPDPLALAKALDALTAAGGADPDAAVAGHFALRFALADPQGSFPYYFYECKARSGRVGTVHGDQGMLMSAQVFRRFGPYDGRLGLLEDCLLADRLLTKGRWMLLPAEILTSPRRFVDEGLYPRQVLNALIMNFAAIGLEAFFREAPDLYRHQDHSRRLGLQPFFRCIDSLLAPLPRAQRRRLWLSTGGYVRSQGWQLGLVLDARRNFRQGLPPGRGPTPWLARFDRWFDRCTDHGPGRVATALLVRCWFSWMLRRRE